MADGAIRVVVSGAAGRMGETVCATVEGADGMELAGRADPALDTPVEEALAGVDVMVDLTSPEAAPEDVKHAVHAVVHAPVGTTGFGLARLRSVIVPADGDARCFVAPTFAIGAVLMMELSKQVSPHMRECEIVALHHVGKQDAPS